MYRKQFMGVLREEAGAADGGLPPSTPPAPPTPQVSEVDQLKARLADTERRLREQPVPPSAPPPQQGDPAAMRKAMENEFWKDPLTVLEKFGNHITAQTQNQMSAPLAGVARDQIRNTDPELFDALAIHVEQNLSGVPDQYKANPTTWQNAFNLAKGQHVDKVLEIRGKSKAGAPGDGPVPVGARPSPAPAGPKLTDEEKHFASKMKLSPEQYEQGKKFYENQDTMWSKVVTFDSDVSRREARAAAASK
jgi:hypothetical protein